MVWENFNITYCKGDGYIIKYKGDINLITNALKETKIRNIHIIFAKFNDKNGKTINPVIFYGDLKIKMTSEFRIKNNSDNLFEHEYSFEKIHNQSTLWSELPPELENLKNNFEVIILKTGIFKIMTSYAITSIWDVDYYYFSD